MTRFNTKVDQAFKGLVCEIEQLLVGENTANGVNVNPSSLVFRLPSFHFTDFISLKENMHIYFIFPFNSSRPF